jgi:hypothetical protein
MAQDVKTGLGSATRFVHVDASIRANAGCEASTAKR